MNAVYLESTRLEEAATRLTETFDVFAPVDEPEKDAPLFQQIPAVRPITIGPRIPLLPLKTLFLPRVEELFQFDTREGGAVTPAEVVARDQVVLGALACDLRCLELLDRALLADPADERYLERRERTTLVALACVGESEACFCASLGIDPLRPSGADALMSPVDKGFVLEPLTDKGELLLTQLEPLVKPATEDQINAASGLTSISRTDVSLDPPPGGWPEVWDSDAWEDTAARCIACGICTVLCPTCYCFDVQDDKRGPVGTRFRVWDSCMSQQFTEMAHGMNPRPEHFSRVRQRFMHKLVYFPERYGAHACVGCGRCARWCPNATGIDEVAARMRARLEGDDDQ
ncbi:MAG: 4Fe-4S dicluster domain-containing protein [Deltaproteobacteria bacterium]|nr:4Fe-4S dicluster domain-containing protein [Deltaproteobacteria bacterium]